MSGSKNRGSWWGRDEKMMSEAIIDRYHLYIYPRPETPAKLMEHIPNVTVVDAPQMDISSTFIRRAIAEGKDVSSFLPEKVYQYIKEKRQYHT